MKTIAKVVFLPVYVLYLVIDKVSYAMMQAGPYGNFGSGKAASFPKCVACRNSTDFEFAAKPTFTVNRFGQARITTFVDCMVCGLRLRVIRSAGTDWSFTEPS